MSKTVRLGAVQAEPVWLDLQGTVEKTIKVHRGRVMEKLGVRSVADLVRLAEKAGILGSKP